MGAPVADCAGAPNPAAACYWRLSRTVTACATGGQILFLDVRRDHYAALPRALTSDFVAWLNRPQDHPPESCRSFLAELDVRGQDPAPFRCLVERPSPLDPRPLGASDSPVRPRDMIAIARKVISAAREIRRCRLEESLDKRFGTADEHEVLPLDRDNKLALFRAVRPVIPVTRVCLHDCLALYDWLGPSAVGVTMTFGVSAFPFAAHCWLQADGEVLDDHPESPSRFQPILHLS